MTRSEAELLLATSSMGRLRGASMAFLEELRAAWPALEAGGVDLPALRRLRDAEQLLEMTANDVLGDASPVHPQARAETACLPPTIF